MVPLRRKSEWDFRSRNLASLKVVIFGLGFGKQWIIAVVVHWFFYFKYFSISDNSKTTELELTLKQALPIP